MHFSNYLNFEEAAAWDTMMHMLPNSKVVYANKV